MNNGPDSSRPSPRLESGGLFFVGAVMLVIALFFDPIGSNPDTGVIELSRTQAKWLLGVFGALFIVAGVVTLIRSDRSQ